MLFGTQVFAFILLHICLKAPTNTNAANASSGSFLAPTLLTHMSTRNGYYTTKAQLTTLTLPLDSRQSSFPPTRVSLLLPLARTHTRTHSHTDISRKTKDQCTKIKYEPKKTKMMMLLGYILTCYVRVESANTLFYCSQKHTIGLA